MASTSRGRSSRRLALARYAALGAVGDHLALGSLARLRDLAGLTGTGLAYPVVSIYAVQEAWTTPWLWPARPAQDRGAAICAALVFAAGLAVITLRGAVESSRD